MNNQQIVDDIVSHITKNGGNFPGWYVGIAADPRARLFKDHNVMEVGGKWIFAPAQSNQDARNVEEYLINRYKTKGDVGGGDDLTVFVYAYPITQSTKE